MGDVADKQRKLEIDAERIRVIYDHIEEHPKHVLQVAKSGNGLIMIECLDSECSKEDADNPALGDLRWWDEWDYDPKPLGD